MFPALTKPLDRWVIRNACRGLTIATPTEISGTIRHLDYFAPAPPAGPWEFLEGGRFQFTSPISTPWPENNRVPGRFVPARGPKPKPGAGKGPAVILLHGWNGEAGYRNLFPPMSWRFAGLGMSVAMIELPYHGNRKPRSGNLRNFLSGDHEQMMRATQQSIADTRAVIDWLVNEGYGPIGLWGFSLGSWLSGLVACADPRLQALVLLTPVPRIDRAIHSLEFCRHIRETLGDQIDIVKELNLTAHQPLLPPDKILLVEAIYDLFAPADAVEELWHCWGKPEIWRARHGHISILFSPWILERMGRWLRRKLVVENPG